MATSERQRLVLSFVPWESRYSGPGFAGWDRRARADVARPHLSVLTTALLPIARFAFSFVVVYNHDIRPPSRHFAPEWSTLACSSTRATTEEKGKHYPSCQVLKHGGPLHLFIVPPRTQTYLESATRLYIASVIQSPTHLRWLGFSIVKHLCAETVPWLQHSQVFTIARPVAVGSR